MKFSVLIANYNNAHFIEETIESVFQQTYSDIEIVIVDDGSTDNIKEVLAKHANNPKMNIVFREKNMGCGVTKHETALVAKGEILGYLDPEDTLTPDAIEIMVNAHKANPDKSIIFSTHYQCNPDLSINQVASWVGPVPKGLTTFETDKVSAFASFKKKDYIATGGMNTAFPRAVDKDMYYKLEELGETLYIDKPLYYYRIHPNGISSYNNRAKAKYWAIQALLDAFERRQASLSPEKIIAYKQKIKSEWKKYHRVRARLSLRSFKIFKFISACFGYIACIINPQYVSDKHGR